MNLTSTLQQLQETKPPVKKKKKPVHRKSDAAEAGPSKPSKPKQPKATNGAAAGTSTAAPPKPAKASPTQPKKAAAPKPKKAKKKEATLLSGLTSGISPSDPEAQKKLKAKQLERLYAKPRDTPTDILEVWFAGCHCGKLPLLLNAKTLT